MSARVAGWTTAGAVLLTGLLLVGGLQAAPPSAQRQRDQVEALLTAPHPVVDAQVLKDIGPEVPALLLQWARRAQSGSQPAVRALALLRYCPEPAVREHLKAVLGDPGAPLRARRVAAQSLAQAYGAQELGTLTALLRHPQLHLREAAAHALGGVYDARVAAALRAQLRRERSGAVRDALTHSLKRQEAAEARVRPPRGRPAPR